MPFAMFPILYPPLYPSPHLHTHISSGSLMVLAMAIVKEEMLVRAVAGESHGGNAQAGERRLEAVPAGEAAGVSPCLSAVSGPTSVGHIHIKPI